MSSPKTASLYEIPAEPYLMTKDLKRHTLDTYVTPIPLAKLMVRKGIEQVLMQLDRSTLTWDNPFVVYDLGAGPGIFGAVAAELLEKLGIPYKIIGFEINPIYPMQRGYTGWVVADVTKLDTTQWGKAHLVVMNPPFVHAEVFVLKAIEMLVPVIGKVFALLPDHFEFYSVRDAFFKKHHYLARYVINRRPSFYNALLGGNKRYTFINKKGKPQIPTGVNTDARHYCLFVFDTIERKADHRLDWDYDNDDPLQQMLQDSKSMHIYALIYEASQAEEGEMCFDDFLSMVSARVLGDEFVRATASERVGMRKAVGEALASVKGNIDNLR